MNLEQFKNTKPLRQSGPDIIYQEGMVLRLSYHTTDIGKFWPLILTNYDYRENFCYGTFNFQNHIYFVRIDEWDDGRYLIYHIPGMQSEKSKPKTRLRFL